MIGDVIKKNCPECGRVGRIIPAMSISTDPDLGGLARCLSGHQFSFAKADLFIREGQTIVDSRTTCVVCGKPIGGGKGDWWHLNDDGTYGKMLGPDGHLAAPVGHDFGERVQEGAKDFEVEITIHVTADNEEKAAEIVHRHMRPTGIMYEMLDRGVTEVTPEEPFGEPDMSHMPGTDFMGEFVMKRTTDRDEILGPVLHWVEDDREPAPIVLQARWWAYWLLDKTTDRISMWRQRVRNRLLRDSEGFRFKDES